MTTLTVDKAAELVISMDEDKSADVIYELAPEPYNKEEHFGKKSDSYQQQRKCEDSYTWRHDGRAVDILSLVEPLLTRTILAKFPEQERAGAVLKEMVSKHVVL